MSLAGPATSAPPPVWIGSLGVLYVAGLSGLADVNAISLSMTWLAPIAVNSTVKAAIPGFMGCRPMAYKLFGIFAIASIIAVFVAVLQHSLWPSA